MKGWEGERELTRAMPSPELLTVPPIHWPLVDSNVYSLNAVSVITKKIHPYYVFITLYTPDSILVFLFIFGGSSVF